MIKIYHFETAMTHLAWHKIFGDLANYYKNNYNSTEIIYLQGICYIEGQKLYCPELDCYMSDCDFVIIDTIKDIIKVITWGECSMIHENGVSLISALAKRNNPQDIMLIGHMSSYNEFIKPQVVKECFIPSSYKFKIQPTTWYPFTCDLSFDDIYEKRKQIQLIDQLFFVSSTRREDPFELAKIGICNPDPTWLGNMEKYILKASNYKVGLAISSVAEKCYREIEYMAIGLPCMRLKFVGEHFPPLIPNYHYIEVNREENGISMENWNCSADRAGGPKYVEAYKKRFLEVKDDTEFLNFISTNARKYFKSYCDEPVIINQLLKQLED